MTNDNSKQFLTLVGRYVSGCITSEEAEILHQLLLADPTRIDILRKNVKTEVWLKEVFQRGENDNYLSSTADRIRLEELSDQPENNKLQESVPQEEDKPSAFEFPETDLFGDLKTEELNNPLTMTPFEDTARKGKSIWQYVSSHIPRPFRKKDKGQTKITDTEKSIGSKEKTRRFPLFFIVRCTFFICLICYLTIENTFFPNCNKDEYKELAQICEVINPEWTQGSPSYKRGQKTGANRISLRSGKVKIRLLQGAEAILEGPGDWVISGSNSLVCSEGKISSDVPPTAHGFEVATPLGNFIDRGTKFAVQVQPENVTLDVVQGKVDMSTGPDQETISLTHGKSKSIDVQKTVRTIPFDETRFLDKEVFEQELVTGVKKKLTTEEEKLKEQIKIPGLLAYYILNGENFDKSANLAVRPNVQVSDLSMTSVEKSEGKYFDTLAVGLKNTMSRLECNVPAKLESMTIIMEVRIDQLRNSVNHLMVANRFHFERGTMAWLLTKDGSLRFFIDILPPGGVTQKSQNTRNGLESEIYEANSVFPRSYLGTWSILAIVIDGKSQQITQYVDGRKVSSEPWKHPELLEPGQLIFGNSNKEEGQHEGGSLNGAIRRICIFDRAVPPKIIREF